jgi:hypothetical protein
MKRIVVLLLVLLSLPLAAHADDASRRDKAKELLILMHTDRTLQQMMDAIMKQTGNMSTQMFGNNLTAAQQSQIDNFQKKIFSLIETNLSYKSLEPDYINMYASNFTEGQLDDMLTFYKSPTGQVVIDKLPSITTQSVQLGQKRMLALLPQIQQMVADFAKNCTDCKTPAASHQGAAAN